MGGLPIAAGARYLGEQIALAITQRASGEDKATNQQMLTLALSVVARSSCDRRAQLRRPPAAGMPTDRFA